MDKTIEISVFGKDDFEIKLNLPELNHTDVTCKELLKRIEEKLNLTDELRSIKLSGEKVFSLGLISSHLELLLKDSYKPFNILVCWNDLLRTFSPKIRHLKPDQIDEDQPLLSLQRNAFLSRTDENRIQNELILNLFYEEAKQNVFDGKYQFEDEDTLAAIQLKIDYLQTNDDNILTTQYLKEHLNEYLSTTYLQSNSNSFLTINRSRSSLDLKINKRLKSDELNLELKDLYKEYLKKCHQLPHYGSVFYHAQIEKNQSILSSIMRVSQDLKVWVAINYDGIHFIDKKSSKHIVSFNYEDFKWELAVPQSICENQNALPCLFIEINDESEKKIMQIFSRQAKLMDNTLKKFDDKIRSSSQDVVDSCSFNGSISSTKSLKKALDFCSCATFDKRGVCVKKQGSLKFIKN